MIKLEKTTKDKLKPFYVLTYYKGGNSISRRFDTLEEARDRASRIYQETGIIVGIERGEA